MDIRDAIRDTFGKGDSPPSPKDTKPRDDSEPPNDNETHKGKTRYDPTPEGRGRRLEKRLIKSNTPGMKNVWIDFNPDTGGVFLDRDELEHLSKIPNIVPQLIGVLGRND